MRVLFLMPNFRAYSEAWMVRMMDALGDDLAVVAAGDTEGATETERGVRVVELNRFKRGRNFLAQRGKAHWAYRMSDVLRVIEEEGVTHVLAHYANFALDFSWLWERTSVPVFVHVHGFDITFDLCDYATGEPVHPAGYAKSVAQLSQRVQFIANSHHTKGVMTAAGVPGDRIDVKYLGVDPTPEPKAHSQGGPVKIISVGRFVDFKAPDKTIRAFARAVELGLDGELTLCGTGPMFQECQDIAFESPVRDRIHFTGAIPVGRVMELMHEADIYTQHNEKGRITHQQEAFGVTLVEAMSIGLPIVGTTDGGPDEIIRGEETGIKVRPGDIEAQAWGLLRLAKDPDLRSQYGRAGWHRAKKMFSAELEGERLRTILASVPGEPR